MWKVCILNKFLFKASRQENLTISPISFKKKKKKKKKYQQPPPPQKKKQHKKKGEGGGGERMHVCVRWLRIVCTDKILRFTNIFSSILNCTNEATAYKVQRPSTSTPSPSRQLKVIS